MSFSAKKNVRDGDNNLADANQEFRVHNSQWTPQERTAIVEEYRYAQGIRNQLHDKLDKGNFLSPLNPVTIARSVDYKNSTEGVKDKTQVATETAKDKPMPLISTTAQWQNLNSNGRYDSLVKKQHHVLPDAPEGASTHGTYGGNRESFATDFSHAQDRRVPAPSTGTNPANPQSGVDHYTYLPPQGSGKGKGQVVLSYQQPDSGTGSRPSESTRTQYTNSTNVERQMAGNRYTGPMPSIQEAPIPAQHSSALPSNNSYPATGSATRVVNNYASRPGQAEPNRAPHVPSAGNPSTSRYVGSHSNTGSDRAPSYKTTPGSNEYTVNDANLNKAPSYASHAPAAASGQASTSNADASGSAHPRSRTSGKHRS